MDFIAMFNLWQTAQAKVNTLPNARVKVNVPDALIEFTIGPHLVLASAELLSIHIALDAAIAINNIINP